jgi:uncharacterized protein (TIGR02145 family)
MNKTITKIGLILLIGAIGVQTISCGGDSGTNSNNDGDSSSSVESSSSSANTPSSSSVSESSSSVVPSSSSAAGEPCEDFVEGTTRLHEGKEKAQFCDKRDGTKYVYVTIGEQIWMAENLNFNASGSVCYNEEPANCEIYGRLYDWITAMVLGDKCYDELCLYQDKHRGICPEGWYVPDDTEWGILYSFAEEGSISPSLGDYETAGKHLKAEEGWSDYQENSGNGLDTYGFAALPGGYGHNVQMGIFLSAGTTGNWWSASENYFPPSAWNWRMFNDNETANRYSTGKRSFRSVRCVRD